ncbi:MAG: cobalamin B12-binding domain-containing protein [Sulfolobales archaeon]
MSVQVFEVGQQSPKKAKVLVAKLGLDGHDRGAKVVARALRDAGFEVVYLGVHQTPEDVVKAAIEEDVSVIGLSILSGSHLELVQDVIKLLKEKGLNIPVIVGGVIPPEDVDELKKLGVYAVCGPGTLLRDIVDLFNKAINTSRKTT